MPQSTQTIDTHQQPAPADQSGLDRKLTEKEILTSLDNDVDSVQRIGDVEKSLLLSLSNDMALVRSTEDMTKIINEKLKKLFLIDDYTIVSMQENNLTSGPYLFDDQSKYFEKKREYLDFLYRNFKFEAGLYDVVLESDTPVVFNIGEIMRHDIVPGHIQFFSDLGIKEVVGAALRIGNENIGVLWIQPERVNCFHLINQNVFRGVCSQISIALANIVANEQIQRKEQEKTLLLSLSNEIVTVRDREDLFQVVNTKLRQLFSIESFCIGLINHDGETHSPVLIGVDAGVKSQVDIKELITKRFSITDGIFDLVLSSHDPVNIKTGELPSQYATLTYGAIWKKLAIDEVLGLPLRVGESNLGCLFVHCNPASASIISNNLLKGVCAQVSIALSNILATDKIARQLEEIRRYKNQLEEENEYLQKEIGTAFNYGEIIGSGVEMQNVYHQLSQVAFTNSTVLIMGETGTGKELIARAIHNASPRKSKLMVKVNCASIPVNLIESELFGHEKGAFTGAIDRRIGKFELAHKSTLFLDEIGEMPLELQVKFLRALQEREIERIGSSGTIKIDVRIVAATNRNLQQEVDEGRFRSDLYYRLNVFPLSLPPLRNRREDIPELAFHFMRRYAKNVGKKIDKISKSVLKEMMAYAWPGNVRELEHLVERSVLLTNGNVIKNLHLSTFGGQGHSLPSTDYQTKTIRENERDHILGVLRKCGGKVFGKTGAAAILGIPVSTLNSRIKKLGIKKERIFE